MKYLLNSFAWTCMLVLICGCGGSSTNPVQNKARIATVFGINASGSAPLNTISVFSDGSMATVSSAPLANGDIGVAVAAAPSVGLIFVIGRTPGAFGGSISVFKFAPDGTLLPAGSGTTATPVQPLSLSVTTAGDLLLVNNNGGGPTVFGVNTSTGALTQLILPGSTGAGGPAVISPDGRFIFLIDGSDVNSYSFDKNTGIATLVSSVLDALFGRLSTQVLVDPSGKFVYTPFRDTGGSATPGGIDGFSVAPDGSLTQLPGSPFAPTVAFQPPFEVNFADAIIDAAGTHLYAIGGNSVYAFSLDQASGVLSPISGSFPFSNIQPFTLTLDPSSKFMLISTLGQIFSYSIGSDGSPTLLPSSPFTAATQLTSLVSVP